MTVEKMNKRELHEAALLLMETKSPYEVAKALLMLKEKLGDYS